MTLSIASVHAAASLRIRLIHVLEEGRTFAAENLRRIGPGQATIENILNGQLELGASGRFLPPVEYQQALELFQ